MEDLSSAGELHTEFRCLFLFHSHGYKDMFCTYGVCYALQYNHLSFVTGVLVPQYSWTTVTFRLLTKKYQIRKTTQPLQFQNWTPRTACLLERKKAKKRCLKFLSILHESIAIFTDYKLHVFSYKLRRILSIELDTTNCLAAIQRLSAIRFIVPFWMGHWLNRCTLNVITTFRDFVSKGLNSFVKSGYHILLDSFSAFDVVPCSVLQLTFSGNVPRFCPTVTKRLLAQMNMTNRIRLPFTQAPA